MLSMYSGPGTILDASNTSLDKKRQKFLPLWTLHSSGNKTNKNRINKLKIKVRGIGNGKRVQLLF